MRVQLRAFVCLPGLTPFSHRAGNHATGESSDGAFARRKAALDSGEPSLMTGITLSFAGEVCFVSGGWRRESAPRFLP